MSGGVKDNKSPWILIVDREEEQPAKSIPGYDKILDNWTKRSNEFDAILSLQAPTPKSLIELWSKNGLQNRKMRRNPQAGTGNDMSEVDAKIAAAEARTDTKFAEMMGELRVISGKLTHTEETISHRISHFEENVSVKLTHIDNSYQETRGHLKTLMITVVVTALTTIIALGGLFYSALQYGSAQYSSGVAAQAIADKSANAVLQGAEPRLGNLEKQIGIILTTLESQKKIEPPVQTRPDK